MGIFLTVNDVLDRMIDLDGIPVEIQGVLSQESECYHLVHHPKVDRRSDYIEIDGFSYRASIVLSFGNGSLQPNHQALNRWIGKRVCIHGVLNLRLFSVDDLLFDWLGFLAPVSISPYSIQRLSADGRRLGQL